MDAFFISAVTVAIAEIGDKTQLLAVLLASRFRRPVPIILGMLTATVLNHTAAGLVGGWVATMLSPDLLRWGLGLLFIAVALWVLVPDKINEQQASATAAGSAFIATALSFFFAEMGDKTQVATSALSAHFGSVLPVVTGTTIGMLAVDVPAVLFGHLAGNRLDTRWVRYIAAILFAAFGIIAILGIELA